MIRPMWFGFAVAAWLMPSTSLCGISVDLPLVQRAIVLDGRVSPEEREGCPRLDLALIGEYDKPKHGTAAYLWRTTDTLYMGVIAEDDAPGKSVAEARDGGAVFSDDSVQLLIAPEADARADNYYHFAVNAAGAKYSNAVGNDRPVPGWRAAVSKGDKTVGYELAIPLAPLNISESERFWRANIARFRPARGKEAQETSSWTNPGASIHNYRRFGFLLLQGGRPGLPASSGAASPVSSMGSSDMTTVPLPASVAVTTESK